MILSAIFCVTTSKKKNTLRAEQFLKEIREVVPWRKMAHIIKLHYYSNKSGRPAYDLILRFKNTTGTVWGGLKVYFSSFIHSISLELFSPYSNANFYNIILPYPQFLEEESGASPEVFTRWENAWGSVSES